MPCDSQTLEPGYYWIKRREPDGPPYWEVARWDGGSWRITGSSHPHRIIAYPASNYWTIGARVPEPPPSEGEE